MTPGRYFWNLLIALDQLLNTLLAGNPDETLSSRAYKASLKGKAWGCILCKLLDKIDKNHCAESVEPDEK
ncbi:hypothetical protein CPT_Percy47 [Caulobacter phage Percy]|uniref:Uncharacterized protein n=1 Tax=Caulobacter phage Percy TaxID=1701809 RepID=A0A0M5M702_9CAUD|nr:hypothetical protein CPT_Percy47 [Caulobacter phage Percy]ALF01681.1 hypothetical protein CPT_Percy47 [Caulobacter phage Percy]